MFYQDVLEQFLHPKKVSLRPFALDDLSSFLTPGNADTLSITGSFAFSSIS